MPKITYKEYNKFPGLIFKLSQTQYDYSHCMNRG